MSSYVIIPDISHNVPGKLNVPPTSTWIFYLECFCLILSSTRFYICHTHRWYNTVCSEMQPWLFHNENNNSHDPTLPLSFIFHWKAPGSWNSVIFHKTIFGVVLTSAGVCVCVCVCVCVWRDDTCFCNREQESPVLTLRCVLWLFDSVFKWI